MLSYTAGVLSNCGNYRAFGDTKFIPELDLQKFKQVVQCSESYETHKQIIDTIIDKTAKEIYADTDPFY